MTDFIAMPNSPNISTGTIVWWHLEGEVSKTAFDREWLLNGFDEKELPRAPTPTFALNKTAHHMANNRQLARPLAGRKGWALVAEHAVGDDLSHSMALRMKVSADGKLVLDQTGHQLATEAETVYARYLATYDQSIISDWLIKTLRALQAVALRETGGVYFVPRDSVPAFRAKVGVLQHVSSCHVFEVPALHSSEAVEAVLAAVTREAKTECEDLEAAFAEGCGKRALLNKAERCKSILGTLAQYEELLGVKMDQLKKRIDDLKAGLVSAALSASAEQEVA